MYQAVGFSAFSLYTQLSSPDVPREHMRSGSLYPFLSASPTKAHLSIEGDIFKHRPLSQSPTAPCRLSQQWERGIRHGLHVSLWPFTLLLSKCLVHPHPTASSREWSAEGPSQPSGSAWDVSPALGPSGVFLKTC